MMQGMMDCGGAGGWLMGGVGILLILLLILGVAALAKYLFWNHRRSIEP
jgi:TM2 domain-containing membrane protein YozV